MSRYRKDDDYWDWVYECADETARDPNPDAFDPNPDVRVLARSIRRVNRQRALFREEERLARVSSEEIYGPEAA